jgi:hypothetical protein
MTRNELGYTYNEVFMHINTQLEKNYKKLGYVRTTPNQDRGNTKPRVSR